MSTLTTFAKLPNTLFPQVGSPTVDPLPDTIHFFGNALLITYLPVFPSSPGTSSVHLLRVPRAYSTFCHKQELDPEHIPQFGLPRPARKRTTTPFAVGFR